MLVAIARELDVSLDYLVFGAEPAAPTPDYGELGRSRGACHQPQPGAVGQYPGLRRPGRRRAGGTDRGCRERGVKESVPLGGLTTAEMIKLEGYSG